MDISRKFITKLIIIFYFFLSVIGLILSLVFGVLVSGAKDKFTKNYNVDEDKLNKVWAFYIIFTILVSLVPIIYCICVGFIYYIRRKIAHEFNTRGQGKSNQPIGYPLEQPQYNFPGQYNEQQPGNQPLTANVVSGPYISSTPIVLPDTNRRDEVPENPKIDEQPLMDNQAYDE